MYVFAFQGAIYDVKKNTMRLIAHSNENGGTDNITAAVISVSLAE